MKKIIIIICLALAFHFSFQAEASEKSFFKKVQKPVNESINIRQKTQKARDEWAVKKTELKAQYAALQEEKRRLKDKNKKLCRELENRQKKVNNLTLKVEDVLRISEELFPFLENTYKRLAEFIENDTPFLFNERKKRIKNLERILYDPAISIAEKFRKLMEAVSIEAEYANTIETYQEKIKIEGKESIMANIFRLGRISLFFLSPDMKTCGVYDPASNLWKKVPPEYGRAIHAAIEIGSKRRPASILELPLGKVVPK